MEEFREVLFVPIEDNVKVGVAGDDTRVDLALGSVDAYFSKFKFDALHHDGVVVVVVEEEDVALVFKRVLPVCLLAGHGFNSNIAVLCPQQSYYYKKAVKTKLAYCMSG